MMAVEQLIGKCAEVVLPRSGVDRGGDAEVSGKNAHHVAIEHGIGLAESKAHDGCCRVVAHSRQGPDEAVVGGECACFCYPLSRSVQMACPAVVAQSLP